MLEQRVAFIGGGNMATALLAGLLDSRLLQPDQLCCSDVDERQRAQLADRFGIQVTSSNRDAARFGDCVVLAVKPQVVDAVLNDCRDELDDKKLLVSICAGVTLSRLINSLQPNVRMIRAMPNTPALVGAGATALARGPSSSDEDVATARALFESVGICVELDEHLLDAVTGLSGSGPAYVMMVIESLAEGGVRAGLPRHVAQRLALQTVLGSAKLAQNSGRHVAELKEQVTSPGGTTAEGVFALEEGGLRYALIDAVCRATARSKELGRG
jgi:pyrroline-5-carboxylate reductase